MVLTQDTLFDFLASQGRKGVVMKLKNCENKESQWNARILLREGVLKYKGHWQFCESHNRQAKTVSSSICNTKVLLVQIT